MSHEQLPTANPKKRWMETNKLHLHHLCAVIDRKWLCDSPWTLECKSVLLDKGHLPLRWRKVRDLGEMLDWSLKNNNASCRMTLTLAKNTEPVPEYSIHENSWLTLSALDWIFIWLSRLMDWLSIAKRATQSSCTSGDIFQSSRILNSPVRGLTRLQRTIQLVDGSQTTIKETFINHHQSHTNTCPWPMAYKKVFTNTFAACLSMGDRWIDLTGLLS